MLCSAIHCICIPLHNCYEYNNTLLAANIRQYPFHIFTAAGKSTRSESDIIADGDRHEAQLFLALSDGTVQLYILRGYAEKPNSSGDILLEHSARTSTSTTIRVTNWLSVVQKFSVCVVLTEKPSPAVFVTILDVVDLGPSGSKEFPLRFMSYAEGITKGTVTFTNTVNGTYFFIFPPFHLLLLLLLLLLSYYG